MSRTYSNFLLFEDVLDNIPTSSPVMVQAVNMLLNPIVKIVAEDCNTLLGKIVDTSLELEGLTENATGDRLTSTRLKTLLSEGEYKVGVRTLGTCLSHSDGGVCRACYSAQYIGETAPVVGTNLSIPSLLIYQSDLIATNGYETTYPLSQTSDDWYAVKVINQGEVVPPANYTIGLDSITFTTTPPLDPVTGVFVVHFYKQNTDPFQGYVAKTYSGGLLGMQPLPSLSLLLRQSLYEAQFSDNFVELIVTETSKLKAIPKTYIEFMVKVPSKLEKILLALYLYSIYGNIEV